ncbi:HD domain-containing protein [Maritalea porphyrae]|uniref:HD domain-containing protein n=1 Tax=Maritalea porphyrae TaxID=880732 RepID=UPI0022B01E62|nr:HD domain-containing protein [Maritalea porphyrae]MCZ4273325.1 HD domain-containing protein [Maritalea porphyrae]
MRHSIREFYSDHNTAPIDKDRGPFKTMASGKRWYYLNPKTDDIDWWDVSNGLAATPRFDGQTRGEVKLSVAQHLFNCALMAQKWVDEKNINPVLVKHVFLHDFHEAYTGDISKPIKSILNREGLVTNLEQRIDKTIYDALELDAPDQQMQCLVKSIDDRMLATEWLWLMPGNPLEHGITARPFKIEIEPWIFIKARAMFVAMFNQLFVDIPQ